MCKLLRTGSDCFLTKIEYAMPCTLGWYLVAGSELRTSNAIRAPERRGRRHIPRPPAHLAETIASPRRRRDAWPAARFRHAVSKKHRTRSEAATGPLPG